MALPEQIQLINATLVALGVVFAMFFGMQWFKRQERHREEDLKLRHEELAVQMQARELARMDIEKRNARENDPVTPGPSGGGYIVLDLPDEEKRLFHDVLKGFEEYAQLRGYKIQFSVDSSVTDKIAFKFTIGEGEQVAVLCPPSQLHPDSSSSPSSSELSSWSGKVVPFPFELPSVAAFESIERSGRFARAPRYVAHSAPSARCYPSGPSVSVVHTARRARNAIKPSARSAAKGRCCSLAQREHIPQARALPNLPVEPTSTGVAPWPRGRDRSSSASRPRHHAGGRGSPLR